jgi:hypothetical protein
VLLLFAAFLAIITVLPPEGRIAAPIHLALEEWLGRAAFVVPVLVALTGLVALVHTLRPDLSPPWRRLAGVGLLLLGVLASEHLLEGGREGTGLVGEWLSSELLDLLGTPLTLFLLALTLGCGTALVFGLKLGIPRRSALPPDAAS